MSVAQPQSDRHAAVGHRVTVNLYHWLGEICAHLLICLNQLACWCPTSTTSWIACDLPSLSRMGLRSERTYTSWRMWSSTEDTRTSSRLATTVELGRASEFSRMTQRHSGIWESIVLHQSGFSKVVSLASGPSFFPG